MNTDRHSRRCRAAGAGLALVAIPILGFISPPAGHAQDECVANPQSLECMMKSDNGFGGSGVHDDWTQPGDLVIPAGGGPPQVAVAPAPPGAPVVTAGGGAPVIPAGPPIG
ncbi:hypothetical protein ORI20_21295 [Mycobacterium sp. CVI_P3]|uniref:Uncharacterized protein n=1 Tax=Mycobacterium pinniadriaticum TaxID=2994102 RepID=A0ABT3SIB2_9MYCO|nr:hypothetical protein [Mycobacterium pinniadriaticum]MCX2932812.1 hypothetical protein [Mycobacterium pinniadriaticum]MCX2939236.1 hypothetical protein [Mycobacterium pinniadriaticum]